MNQILSVDSPKKNVKNNRNKEPGKASTKSVLMFFCIILIIFGIGLISLGVFSNLNRNKQNEIANNTPNNIEQNKPRIDITQNASELDVEVLANSEITKIEYDWNNGEKQNVDVDGRNNISFRIEKIPSGQNTLTVIATDINGLTDTFTRQYVGAQEANVSLAFDPNTGKLKIICVEEKNIAKIAYYYDNEQEQIQEVNNTQTELEIPVMQGEHDLTVTLTYEDGSTRNKSEKIYFPIVNKVRVPEDGSYAVITASDARKITRVTMNLNGEDLPEQTPNSVNFETTINAKSGENRLILTVYNTDGVSITTRTRWDKK